jgi:hypothetical protein
VSVVIKDCNTLLFLQQDLRWTDSLDEAVHLKNGVGAWNFADSYSIKDVQLLCQFGDKEYDFSTPISANCR